MTIAVDIRCLLEPRRTGVGEYAVQVLSAMLQLQPKPDLRLVGNVAGRRKVTLDLAAPLKLRHLPNRWLNLSVALTQRPRFNRLFGPAAVYWLPNLGFAAFDVSAPYVVTLHDLSFLRYPQLQPRRGRLWHTLVGYRRLLAGATHVIAVSQHTRRDAISAGLVLAERISTVASGVAAHFQAPADAAADQRVIARLGLTQGYLLALGSHDPRKNLRLLVEALPKLPGQQLVVAGPPQGGVALRRQAQRLGVAERLRCVGYVADHDRPALYRGAAAFAYPSLYEGFGLPILEAMASGVPVVASASSSVPEVAADAALLADPYDGRAWVDSLRHVLADTPVRQQLIARGRTRAAEFTWQRTARLTLEILEKASVVRR